MPEDRAMPEELCPVRRIDQQAVVTLPRYIDSWNAGQVRVQLLQVINSDALVLIADLAGTVSCDYSGANAIARAYQRAVASGTELRLVVAADVVRRALSLNGLHRLIPMYPTLDAALARAPAPAPAADTADLTAELLDRVVNTIFSAAMSLRDAADNPREAIGDDIDDALSRLDSAVREIRDHVFASQSRAAQPARPGWRPPDMNERAAATERSALLRQRIVETAHVLRAASAETAALLQQRSDLVSDPSPVDYPADIKRWRSVADQAEEMAQRWERHPLGVSCRL